MARCLLYRLRLLLHSCLDYLTHPHCGYFPFLCVRDAVTLPLRLVAYRVLVQLRRHNGQHPGGFPTCH